MRFIMIEEDLNVKELFIDPSDIFDGNILDCTELDEKHDLWYPDNGMGHINGFVTINDISLPLPVYVAGFDGEETIAAEIEVDEVRSMIS